VDKLIYWEVYNDSETAQAREKQIKGWLRKEKVELIEAMNPKWEDLSFLFRRNETLLNKIPQRQRWISGNEIVDLIYKK